jgi:hypothetical protein
MRRICLIAAGLLAFSGLVSASTAFLGVCGTGFFGTVGACTTLGTEGSSTDVNWELNAGAADVTDPFSTWVDGGSGGRWIAPGPSETSASQTNGAGPFGYTETFTITADEVADTADVVGSFACDNDCTLTLNGNTVATLTGTGQFLSLTGFTIDTSFFVAGLNTLEVSVTNAVNTPTGAIVEITTDTISTAPEPGAFGFIGLGLAALSLFGRRLRSPGPKPYL